MLFFAVACPFVCHPVGICFCRCPCFVVACSLSTHQTNVISTEGGALCRRSGEIPVFRSRSCLFFLTPTQESSFRPERTGPQRAHLLVGVELTLLRAA